MVGLVSSLGFLAEGCIVVQAIAFIAFPAVGWTVVPQVGVATSVALGMCGLGVLVNGRSQLRCHCEGCGVSPSFLLSLLTLLTAGIKQFAVGKDSLVGKLLILLLDPVDGFTVLY